MIIESIALPAPQKHMLKLRKATSGQTYCYVYFAHQIPMVVSALTLDAMRPDVDMTLSDVAEAFFILDRIHKDAQWPKENSQPGPSQNDAPQSPPKNWWTP